MSAKKVTFGSQPQARPDPVSTPDQWVEQRTADEKPKRMTFDVPENLHRRVKVGCALRGVTIREVILELLEREFPA
jgi:hypothetical protein